jgi:protein-S-isoprenylcysteine O-methyltransferase Ste14
MALLLKTLAYGVGSFLLVALALFLPAGTLAWPAGWIFLILLYGLSTITVGVLYKINPGLLAERMNYAAADQKAWDKVLMPFYYLLALAWAVLIPLDAVRFHWSQVPLWLQVVGGIAVVAWFPLLYLVFRENSYLAPTIRVQKDRGQTVISTGPYHYVRHPMYACSILLFLGTPLLLGSWYGVLFSLIMIVGMGARAVMEERTLRDELPGYKEYLMQVKYRFVPYLW